MKIKSIRLVSGVTFRKGDIPQDSSATLVIEAEGIRHTDIAKAITDAFAATEPGEPMAEPDFEAGNIMENEDREIRPRSARDLE